MLSGVVAVVCHFHPDRLVNAAMFIYCLMEMYAMHFDSRNNDHTAGTSSIFSLAPHSIHVLRFSKPIEIPCGSPALCIHLIFLSLKCTYSAYRDIHSTH